MRAACGPPRCGRCTSSSTSPAPTACWPNGSAPTGAFRPVEGSSVLACTVTDTSGELTALFYGRTHITGLRPGGNVKLRGTVGITSTGAVMVNPAYELLD